jgi:hypothetical protein
MERSVESLMERVDELLPVHRGPIEWGHEQHSSTPTPLRIEGLAKRIDALETALRSLALEVQRLSARR